MGWLGIIYAFLNNVGIVTGHQSGVSGTIAADGTATATIAFPSAYANSVTSFVGTCGVNSIDATAAQSISVLNVTLTGATVQIFGGPVGSNCVVYWEADGT